VMVLRADGHGVGSRERRGRELHTVQVVRRA
jgi:hypothetical protein